MATTETPEAGKSRRKPTKKYRKKRRLGIRIDMTPMVDVAFLLLTFFMLTTVFNRPQTMEINLPPEESRVEVPESNVLILRVAADDEIYWSIGFQESRPVAFDALRPLLVEQNRLNSRLIVLIKIDRQAPYENMINIIDELNLGNINRFSLASMLPADLELIQKAGASNP